MQEKTNHVAEKTQSLESNEQMRGMMPPPFSFADGDGGNVKANIGYLSQISYEDGEPATEYGITVPSVVVQNLGISKEGEKFQVNADFICWPKITLWAGDNALGHLKNIEDENSKHITAANYIQVSNELYPDAYGQIHSPNYWSKPVTRFHEEVHAADMVKVGPESLREVVLDRIEERVFEDATDLELEVYQYAENMKDSILFKMRKSGEKHAFEEAKPKYIALARAIYEKGKAGGYK